MSQLQINALLTEVGVNMGDHAETVTRAIVVKPDMTVKELCTMWLSNRDWLDGSNKPADNKFLTLRVAVEVPE